MGIRQQTTDLQIAKFFQEEIKRGQTVILNTLNRIGFQCVTEARDNGNYLDDTGNLRSSIGYAILENGKVNFISDFDQVKQGVEGQKEGEALIRELAREYPKGFVLVVVAGMEYAAYVATKRNVIESAELLAKRLVPRILGQLGFIVRS